MINNLGMLTACTFFNLITTLVAFLLILSPTLLQFAIFSECLWLCFYCLTVFWSIFDNTVELYTSPFVVLVLTAVEATSLWTLIVFFYLSF